MTVVGYPTHPGGDYSIQQKVEGNRQIQDDKLSELSEVELTTMEELVSM